MARMIPAYLSDDIPPGERDVYASLENCPPDWVVLHSLDVAPWNNRRRTEIDFVVLIPDTGILCIEVKSHNDIQFDGSAWYPASIKRSPFKQAMDASKSFQRQLSSLVPSLSRCPVSHCCIFPNAYFEITNNLSVRSWELIDTSLFRVLRESKTLCVELTKRLHQGILSDDITPLSVPMSTLEVNNLIGACLPIQKRRPDAREEIRRIEQATIELLREQQKPILVLSDNNKRIIVSGPAGTGKTLIAVEVAQRIAKSGKRVALLTFNKLVGDWLVNRMTSDSTLPPNLVVGRAYRVMSEILGVPIPASPPPDFWDSDLLDNFEDLLTNPEVKGFSTFDHIVLDEAQDFLARPRLFTCLCQFLDGGLRDGSFTFFGDFQHQSIHNPAAVNRLLEDVRSVARPVEWNLSENCRNYQTIGKMALCLSGKTDDVYSGFLRPIGDISQFKLYFYDSFDHQTALLRQLLLNLKQSKFRTSEISILSFRRDDDSPAQFLANSGTHLRPAWQLSQSTSYTSVHSFKGMENKVIILTDVARDNEGINRDLFYTGLTRATEQVHVLCETSAKHTVAEWLTGNQEK
jgi:hypothetical protein